MILNCEPDTDIAFSVSAEPSYSFFVDDIKQKKSIDSISVCSRQKIDFKLQYKIGSVVIEDAVISLQVIDTNKAKIVKMDSSFKIQGLSSGKSSLIIIGKKSSMDSDSLSLKDTLGISILGIDLPQCFIKLKQNFEVLKEGFRLATNTTGNSVVNSMINDTVPIELSYYENNQKIIADISIHWDSTRSNGIYTMENLEGNENILTIIKAGMGFIFIRVLSSLGDTIYSDSIFINGQNITEHRIDYKSPPELLDRQNIGFCLDSTFSISATYFMNNISDDSVDFLWETTNENVLSLAVSDTTREPQILMSLISGTVSMYISVFKSGEFLFKDTLSVEVKDLTNSACFVNTDILVYRKGKVISKNENQIKLTTISFDVIPFQVNYTENLETIIGVSVQYDTTLSNGVYQLLVKTSNTFTLQGLKSGRGKVIINVTATDTMISDTLTVDIDTRGLIASADFSGSAYGLSGSVAFTQDSLFFENDFTFGTAPGAVIYLSNSTGLSAGAPNLGVLENYATGPFAVAFPDETDVTDFTYIVIWCEPFSITLGKAEIEFQ